MIFRQKEVDTTCCRGRFFVPKSELPIGGFVRLLLEVSTGVGKAKMNLIGAAFDIQGHRPFGEVKWKLRTRKNKGEADEDDLDFTISAFPNLARFSGQLEKVAQLLSKGMQKLAIGTGE
ncbi:MAG: hypothetical protein NTW96_00160 [Planctomycetia bacterium]|nr:hypothetical protein [Planctomycetia bacterium]